MTDDNRLVATTTGADRQAALLRAVGFDRLNDAQRELALAIANRYDLDPMLRHLVMIDGKPYITRDGLLHVAHRSGRLDGIETTEPVLVDGFWRSTCSVYRNDMTRPFTYTGRYPEKGSNAKFAPEMATKVGEVMSLRRAFDVAAPTSEERWDQDEDASAQPARVEPVSLTDRIAAKVEVIDAQAAPEPQESTLAAPAPEVDASFDSTIDAALDAPEAYDDTANVSGLPPVDADAIAAIVDAGPSLPTFDDFKVWAVGRDNDLIKRTAKELYPEGGAFKSLSGEQYAAIIRAIETQRDPTTKLADAMAGQPVVLCGSPSPYGDGATCTRDAGHDSNHRSGTRESWA